MINKKDVLYNEIKQSLMNYLNVITNSPTGLLTTVDSIEDFFDDVDNSIKAIYKAEKTYIDFIKNEYDAVMHTHTNTKGILDKALEEMNNKYYSFIFPYDEEEKNKYLNRVNTAFDEDLKIHTETLKKREDKRKDFYGVFPRTSEEVLKKLTLQDSVNIEKTIVDIAKKNFVNFRNKYYNPLHSLPDITLTDVSKWLDKYMELAQVSIYPELSVMDLRIHEIEPDMSKWLEICDKFPSPFKTPTTTSQTFNTPIESVADSVLDNNEVTIPESIFEDYEIDLDD